MFKSTEQLIQEVKALKGLGCPAEQKALIDLVLALASEKKAKPAAEPVKEEKVASVSTFKKLVGGGKK